MWELPKFSFCLPVYNAEKYLERCLRSIQNQDYPKEKIEVLLVDGGSSDKTRQFAKDFGIMVFDNPKRLADFGAKIAASKASGELFVIFAADNELISKDWLKTVADVFNREKNLACLWGRMLAAPDDAPINKYYELIQNDPLSFFVNKNLQKYIKQAKPNNINGRDFYFFEVAREMPLIWGANGLVYKTDYVRDIILRDEFIADNDVFQIMIESGKSRVAYSYDLNVYHHHLVNLITWIRKWRRNYIQHYLKQRRTRNLGWVSGKGFTIKLILWILYSGIPIFSLAHSIFLSIKHKNKYWLYHPVVSFAQMTAYLLATVFTKDGWNLILRKKA